MPGLERAGEFLVFGNSSKINNKFLFVAFCLLCANLLCTPTWSSESKLHLRPAEIKSIVQSMDILQPESRDQVYAACQDGICTVSIFRHPDATRQDCKIDAVLLTRNLITRSSQIALVRCLFYNFERQNEFWDVSVRPALVTAFGAGKINQAKLLNSITLVEDQQANPLSEKYKQASYAGILNDDTVVSGPFSEHRLALELRLKDLRSKNIEVTKFNQEFLRIEDAARRGNEAGLKAQVDALDHELDLFVQSLISSGQLPVPNTHLSRSLDLPPGKPPTRASQKIIK